MADLPSKQAIEHIVVLMLENRSFDSLLGKLHESGPEFDGLTDEMANWDSEGTRINVRPAASMTTRPDPKHDLASVTDQLIGPNRGFVYNYETKLKPDDWSKRVQVMEYQTEEKLPLLYKLANEYAVSDQWFSSVPSQTWPNRLFVHCATSFGKVSNRPWQWRPPKLYPGPSIFQRLGKKVTDWACYSDQIPISILVQELADEFRRSRHEADSHFRSLDQFETDCRDGLPSYSFIEPSYLFESADDDHPPHSLKAGQRLIRRIYRAVSKYHLWTSTLLLILYDEHGGFFDHVLPPPAPPPHPFRRGQNEANFRFARLGPRVPCILVSAWMGRGKVFRPPEDSFFDHTSVIKTLRERWDLGKHLTSRDAAAASVWHALNLQEPRTDDADILAALDDPEIDLGPPVEDSLALRTSGRPGLVAAAQIALTAPLAAVPGLRQLPAFREATGLNRDLALLGGLVAAGGIGGAESIFDPADA